MARPAAKPNAPAAPKALRDLVAAWPEPAVLVAPRWHQGGADIVAASAALAALFGHDARSLAGANTRVFFGAHTEPGLLRQEQPDFARAGLHGQGWLHRRDGSAFFGEWRFTPLDGGGRLIGVYRDLTEHNRLQQALVHSQQLDTVGQLSGGMAHDLNNLLSVVNGMCEVAVNHLDQPAEAKRNLQEAHRAGQRAADITRQLLEFSRRREVAPRVINFNTLTREIADILRRALGEDIVLELRLATGLGNARIDPTQVQRALLNLCLNARDAMPEGGTLAIRTANQARAGRPGVALSVRDTGHGMDAATRARIFEPFFTTKPHGTGLGLANVRQFFNAAGGDVTVESEPGRGATFEVWLPETPETVDTLSPVAGTPLAAMQGHERILLIESDAVLRPMLTGLLNAQGYRVREAATLAAATAATAQAVPELVILHSTSRKAAAFLASLHARNPLLRVLSLDTALPSEAKPALPPRALAHLPKPFPLHTFLRTVRLHLDSAKR
jgi:PAS domain S-box-containing protein